MKELITVSMFTAKDMIKRKAFIISNIIVWLIIILAFNIPNIIKLINGKDQGIEKTKILISDSQNVFVRNFGFFKQYGAWI